MNLLSPIGYWTGGDAPPAFTPEALDAAVREIRRPLHVVQENGGGAGAATAGRLGVASFGRVLPGPDGGTHTFPLLATLPAIYPEWLGDRSFCEVHRVRFPYVAGEMANGIATAGMVIAMARANMLGFFGAAGLAPGRVSQAIDEIQAALGNDAEAGPSWGSNLIHSPAEPAIESEVADLYIRRGVRRASASAFMALTPPIVRYAAAGLTRDAQGRIVRRHHVFAKISRPEVAERFMSPAPKAILDALLREGKLTSEEVSLAAQIPIAEDVTVEADSGGHTDNRPLGSLFPIIQQLRDQLAHKYGYTQPIRVGAAGGLGTPSAVASAFALGAAYVLTGSINQSAVESGLSPAGKHLLAQAGIADVMMAPAADMFEMGVKVQVLKRGTMFGVRAQRLYDLYIGHVSWDDVPATVRERVEREILGATFDEVWAGVVAFFGTRDPATLKRAERDPKHRMALVFRWYLGLSSKWAIAGDEKRLVDYQIWCGPAMAAFNDWVRGSSLAAQESRQVVQIALNLLEGAAVLTRAHQLRTHGVAAPASVFQYTARPLC